MLVLLELVYDRCQPDLQPSVQRASGCDRKPEYRQKTSIVQLKQRNSNSQISARLSDITYITYYVRIEL